jgi:hypothetical protein
MGDIYESRIVAFIDILGWSKACEVESLRLANAIGVIHAVARNYSETIKQKISEASKGLPTRYAEIHVGAMSDSLVISAPASQGYTVFGPATMACTELLKYGFLTRGGITVGDLHHRENVVFGPALVEAVQLEREAIYPRLICSRGLLTHLEQFARPTSIPVISDHLGRNIANLFTIPVAPPGKMPAVEFARSVWGLDAIENVIDSELQRYSVGTQKDEKIAEKWHYMKIVTPLMIAEV